ncbi:killer cell lectin-like receptor subfamily B member 1B allele C [Rhinatrema bivittatum]|uniref:killer cell lectin-like receptor subfamily B member 1B allele C n=1 Tax=Rhinatrema bivittatum TaxID=194408 RepID=UPI00112D6106|nr:killer cell lectin-like receptor subfamily B member 1B allele C [Rhinatrema bivittatum]
MAGEVLYADLKLPGASSQPPCLASGQTQPQCPQWHRPALRVSGVLNLLLLLAVIALSVFGFLCNQEKVPTKSNKPLETTSSTKYGNSCTSPATAAPCPCLPGNGSCPMNWLRHKGKCYYFSRDTERSWSRSREDCAERDSQLLLIQEQEEKDFIHHQAGARYHWIGLHIPAPGRNWTWLDDSPFNQTLVSVSGSMGQDQCVAVDKSRFYSDSCSSLYEWICQKEAKK